MTSPQILRLIAGAIIFLFFLDQSAFAQQTGGVFGPGVTPGARDAEVRVSFSPADNGRPDTLASRFHYQHSLTDNFRLRGVVQGRGAPIGGFDYDFVQFEAQWQFRDQAIDGWSSALRFDLQFAGDQRDLVSFNWTSDVPLSEQLTFRNIILAQVQFGDGAQDGLFLQTRSALKYKLNSTFTLDLQSFNIYGSTAGFPDFDQQNHALGPALSGKLGNGWSFEASALFGVSAAASDADLRLFLVKSF